MYICSNICIYICLYCATHSSTLQRTLTCATYIHVKYFPTLSYLYMNIFCRILQDTATHLVDCYICIHHRNSKPFIHFNSFISTHTYILLHYAGHCNTLFDVLHMYTSPKPQTLYTFTSICTATYCRHCKTLQPLLHIYTSYAASNIYTSPIHAYIHTFIS